ncbi:FtsK/SpoIIIE domain-containing protein [Candidatus Chloroploca sp. Khr17]|uniref:FtsK/SpoIIIE domain-containing protein n=1 Tax=Candidatus Chloroploca sp. Khr17 TaxID=2496869 RepID=UPI00101BF200|nr:FtsK/SpoIIIE domain-containing protein [Candidatus Chloroploca sp. Khr17]
MTFATAEKVGDADLAASGGSNEQPLTLFNRPPRILRTLPDDEINIPGPPQEPTMRGGMRLISILIPLISSLVYLGIAGARSSTAGAGSMLSALPIVVIGMLTGGAAFYTYRQQKREYEAALVTYRETYQAALEKIRRQLQQLERQQRSYYEENDPDLKTLLQIAHGEINKKNEPVPSSRLWERRPEDADFLALRIGRGDRPTSVTIKPPSVNAYTKDVEDSLLIAEQFRLVRDVPVSLNLRTVGSIGIAGPDGRTLNLLQALIWQLVIHHSSSEVRIAAFWDATFDDSWDWLRYLPHTRPLDGDESYRLLARYDRNPEDSVRVLSALSKELKRRREDDQRGQRPHLVVILSSYLLHREDYPLFAQLITGRTADISAICLVPEVRDVPSECGGYIDLVHGGSPEHARLGVAGKGGGYSIFKADMATTEQSRELALRIAPVELADTDGGREMPRNVPLLSLLGILDAATYDPQILWAKAPTDSWHPVPVGAQGAGVPMEINLNEGIHGVHGMIAGATGAGKSELLLSFLMALAIRHHPDRLNFLLIDFKGGATFRDLEALPHTSGMVTDLSGFMAERALIAMNSELDRRKRLLSAKGVPNIKSYRRAGFDQRGEPLPNLFIAIDEFDEMIRDYPQFQDELIRVGKQGRSLGVHLLFATQQPSLIKEGLQNNLSYWMSLRVNSKDDSRTMLGLPDAAQLGTDTPGRGFLRDKNSGVRVFQSALITSTYRQVTGRSTSEIDLTGHLRINTSETRAQQMFEVELDDLVNQLKTTLTESGRNKLIEASIASMCKQFNELFERNLTETELKEQHRTTRAAIDLFLQALHQLSYDPKEMSEAEAIDHQINLASRKLITLLMGNREQISEIRLVARHMVEAQGARYAAQKYRIWEEPLPATLPLAELMQRSGGKANWLDVPFGVVDQPELACHDLLTTDLAGAGGNLLALGASGSGKTTLLQTIMLALAHSLSPTELWFYVIDSTGAGIGLQGKLPHLAHVLGPRQHLLIERMFVELQNQLEDRRTMFQQQGVASLSQYRERYSRQPDGLQPPPPALVIVIDNLAEVTNQNELVLETLKTFMRESRAYGIYFLVSAYTMREVGSLLANFETRIALRLNSDDDSAALIGKDYASKLIKPDQPGRAFLRGTPRPIEVQLALPALRSRKVAADVDVQAEEKEVAYSDLVEELQRSADLIRATWQHIMASGDPRKPQGLHLLPPTVEVGTLLTQLPPDSSPTIPLGIESASLQPLLWSLEQNAHLLITGGLRNGKRSLLRTLILAATRRMALDDVEFVLVDYSMRALRDLAALPQVRTFAELTLANKEVRDITVVTEKDEFLAVLQKLTGELAERLNLLRRGLPITRRTIVIIHNWDLVAQDNPMTTAFDPFVRRGSDVGLHCVISYTDPMSLNSGTLLRAVRASAIEVISGRPPSDSAPYAPPITKRFKSVLASEMPPGRGFVLETGQPARLVQLAYASPEYVREELKRIGTDSHHPIAQ